MKKIVCTFNLFAIPSIMGLCTLFVCYTLYIVIFLYNLTFLMKYFSKFLCYVTYIIWVYDTKIIGVLIIYSTPIIVVVQVMLTLL